VNTMDVVAALIDAVRLQRHVIDYVYISTTVIFIYDYFLTLHLEIKYIWLSSWTYTKVFFLVIRYLSFGSVIMMLYHQTIPDIPAETCRISYPVSTWMILVALYLAEVVIVIRTWAVWHRNKIIGLGLGAIMIANIIFSCVITNRFIKSMEFGPPLYPGYRGCFITKIDTTNMWHAYFFTTIVETTLLTLMVISAFRTFRSDTGRRQYSELTYVIHRDGVLFNFYLLSITVINLAAKLAAPTDSKYLFDTMLDVLHPILVARIFINIRKAGSGGVRTELHTDSEYHEAMVFAMPLQLVSGRPTDLSTFSQSTTGSLGAEFDAA